ncbi:MAG: DUF1329 domain-containing protein [Proteobacteria bacterium]|nr:DUF1329 domain-containing protein [Pseudomonadota bacterium]
MKIYKTGNLVIVLFAFIFTLLLPGALIGADIPSIKDVVEGKAKLPTIEDLTGGKVKIGDMIDKNNVELVKEYITPGVYESVKRGMVLRMGTQLSPDKLNPKAFREATERNRGKAVMDKNGAVYYGKTGIIWPGGYPFPWTENGLEALANHTYGVVWDTWYGLPAFLWYVNSKGKIYKTSGQEVMYVKYSGRTLLPPLGLIPGYDNILIKKISLSTSPRELKGLGQLTERHV